MHCFGKDITFSSFIVRGRREAGRGGGRGGGGGVYAKAMIGQKKGSNFKGEEVGVNDEK